MIVKFNRSYLYIPPPTTKTVMNFTLRNNFVRARLYSVVKRTIKVDLRAVERRDRHLGERARRPAARWPSYSGSTPVRSVATQLHSHSCTDQSLPAPAHCDRCPREHSRHSSSAQVLSSIGHCTSLRVYSYKLIEKIIVRKAEILLHLSTNIRVKYMINKNKFSYLVG